MIRTLLLAFWAVVLSFGVCSADNGPVTESLLNLPATSSPTVVHAWFHLNNIDSIDDEAETFQFSGVLTLRWKDPRQAFVPTATLTEKIYQGDFQYNELAPAWFPQVVLSNRSEMFDTDGVLLRVQPDGTSMLVQSVSAIAKSRLDLTRYPFDSQGLFAVFEFVGWDTAEVLFQIESEQAVTIDENARVAQWTIHSVGGRVEEDSAPYAGKSGRTSTFTVQVEVMRQPFFMIRLVVLPLMLIVVLSWSVFWMERSSLGDRINISFIGILTAVAYQNVVGGILPQISYVTLITGFLNISFLVMSATVVVNLYVGWCDQRGRHTQGDLIDARCRRIFPLVYFSMLLLLCVVTVVFF